MPEGAITVVKEVDVLQVTMVGIRLVPLKTHQPSAMIDYHRPGQCEFSQSWLRRGSILGYPQPPEEIT